MGKTEAKLPITYKNSISFQKTVNPLYRIDLNAEQETRARLDCLQPSNINLIYIQKQ